MSIDHQNKIIFVHIPKTAGLFIRKVLKIPSASGILEKDHIRPSYPFIKPYWEKYFTFTFVRNPYDRLVSSYFFDHKRFKEGKIKCEGNIRKAVGKYKPTHEGFQKFVKTYISKHFNNNRKYVPMSQLLEGASVDYIGRVENIEKDLKKIYYQIHHRPLLKVSTIRQNTSTHKGFMFYFKDEEFKRMVYNYYEEDFKLFNYMK